MDWLFDHNDVVPEFCGRMSSFYPHFKAIHGCRPESLSSYYADGLQGQNAEAIIQRFRSLFLDVPLVDLEQGIEEMQHRESSEKGKVRSREMIKRCWGASVTTSLMAANTCWHLRQSLGESVMRARITDFGCALLVFRPSLRSTSRSGHVSFGSC